MRKRYRKPHRIRRRKSIFKNKGLWALAFGFLVFGAGFYFFAFSDFFRIQAIIITGSQRVSKENLESVIKAEAPNIIFFDSGKIRELVLEKFPQIAELEIKKSFPNVLNLALAERKEVGVFCSDEQCFLLDAQGIIFQTAPKDSGLLLFYNQTLKGELRPGENVFDKQTLALILDIDKKLKNSGILTKEYLLASTERLNVKTAEGWEIYFNIKKDLAWQLTSLATVLEKGITPEKRGLLKYIDLRFDKIFVYPECSATQCGR